MNTIQATYYGPTNTKGSRFKIATHERKARYVPFEYGGADNTGIDVQAVRDYCAEVFPYADANTLTGPHFIKPGVYVFTFAA